METALLDAELQRERSPLDPDVVELLGAALDRDGVEAASAWVQEPGENDDSRRRLFAERPDQPAGRCSHLALVVFTQPGIDNPQVLHADLEGAIARALRRAGVESAFQLKTPNPDFKPHQLALAALRRAGRLIVDRAAPQPTGPTA